MNHLKNTLLLGMLVLCSSLCFCQEKTSEKETSKIEARFEGMLGIAFGNNAVGITVGGPSLKFKITPNFKIGAGAFPSLLVLDKKAFPRLAVSPIIEYKKWMLITPYYGYDSKDKMIWLFGLGYKFK